MTSIFDKLNLKPAERRLVVFVALFVFVVLNFFFVWPKFFELGKLQARRKAAQNSLDQFKREVDRTAEYQRRLRELEKQGASVASEDQALKLSTTVYSQAALSGVQVVQYTPVLSKGLTTSSGKTNVFFDEQSGTIQFIAEEKNLVDFLYNLGIGGSMIRVRSMTLNTDPPRQKLQGNLTLVASYARAAAPSRPAGAPAPAPAPAAAPGPRPGAPAASKSISAALKPAPTNAPAKQPGWWSRLWPFGNKEAAPAASTNAPASAATAPAKTNPPPKK